MRIQRVDQSVARQQASWIVRMEPWRSLGYTRPRLAAWLAQQASERRVFAATRSGRVLGLVVAQPDFLLGTFIALLVVRPDSAGQGIGRALVEDVTRRTARRRRWLYTSCDALNRDARRFYRRFGFERVGALRDLIRKGRTEILLRKEVDLS
jgi:[ribosomal protein S18]-alanine N-acetyltransferase